MLGPLMALAILGLVIGAGRLFPWVNERIRIRKMMAGFNESLADFSIALEGMKASLEARAAFWNKLRASLRDRP